MLAAVRTFIRPIIFDSRNSSVGRALDWRSKGPWFNPGFRHPAVVTFYSFTWIIFLQNAFFNNSSIIFSIFCIMHGSAFYYYYFILLLFISWALNLLWMPFENDAYITLFLLVAVFSLTIQIENVRLQIWWNYFSNNLY